jgi:hypothetical protein
MKAYALVQGPRRKVLCMSDSTFVLYATGAAMFEFDRDCNRTIGEERAICKKYDAYIVRVDYQLGDPITAPRKNAEKQAA